MPVLGPSTDRETSPMPSDKGAGHAFASPSVAITPVLPAGGTPCMQRAIGARAATCTARVADGNDTVANAVLEAQRASSGRARGSGTLVLNPIQETRRTSKH